MGNKIKKLTVALMALMLAFAFAACGEDETIGTTEGIEHTHEYEETVVVAPTCTKTGTMFLKCKSCGDVDYKEISATGHTEVTDAAVEASCMGTGLTEGKHCSVCNEVLVKQEVVAVKEHTEVIDEAVAPTCSKTGLTEGSHCSCCGKILVPQEVVDTVAHDYEQNILIAPTCEDGGLAFKKCKICGDSDCVVIPCNGHEEVVDEAVAATCTSTGLTEGLHCSVCNKVLVEQEVTEITNHQWEMIPAVEAKCDKPGLTEGVRCAHCGLIDIEQQIVRVSHEFEDGTCINCGRAQPSNGLVYNRNSEGYTVLGGTCKDSHVVIPDTHNNLPVTAIGADAFLNCSTIKTVEIPDTVTTIEARAFYGSGLTNIVIPDSVTSIGMFAFDYCNKLTDVTISCNVKNISNGVFASCDLRIVKIPDGVIEISGTVFYKNENLTSVYIPSSVQKIGQEVFNYCSKLTDIYFAGTSDQWYAISKGLKWIITAKYTVHCTDGDIPYVNSSN